MRSYGRTLCAPSVLTDAFAAAVVAAMAAAAAAVVSAVAETATMVGATAAAAAAAAAAAVAAAPPLRALKFEDPRVEARFRRGYYASQYTTDVVFFVILLLCQVTSLLPLLLSTAPHAPGCLSSLPMHLEPPNDEIFIELSPAEMTRVLRCCW